MKGAYIAPSSLDLLDIAILMDIRVHVGQRIRDLRIGLDMTQPELADRVGMRVASISEMERGDIGPSLNSLAPIADALHTTVPDLFKYVASKYSKPKRQLKLLTQATDRLAKLDETHIRQIIDQLDVTLSRLQSKDG